MQMPGSALDKLWTSAVAFVVTSVIFGFVAGWVAGGLTRPISLLALILGGVFALLTILQRRSEYSIAFGDPEDSCVWLWRWAVWICYALFAFRAFLWLVYDKDGQVTVLSPNNLGDLPLHIQYIRFLAGGASLWPVNPIHAHSTIGYPIGMDFFNALLECCGVDLWKGLIVTGLLGAGLTGLALYRWGGTFALAAFLFNGGIIGLNFFAKWDWQDYQQTVDWKSIPLALFVTQRGFLYALPAGLLLLTQWQRNHAQEEESENRLLPFWLEWLVYGTMPLFHFHTFLFLSAVLGSLALFGFRKRQIWILIGCSLLPATWLVLLLTDYFQAGSQLGWLPGWMEGKSFSILYWLKNFGAMPIFFLLLVVHLLMEVRQPTRRAQALLVIPAALVFLATLFIKFSPWEWDNTKLMMWSYLVMMPILWRVVLRPTHVLLQTGACFLLFFSGFLSLWGGLGPQFKGNGIASRSEIEDVGVAVKNLPIEAVFAAAPDYAHPLVFNGRRVALGYHGHMTGHGLKYHDLEGAMDDLMSGHVNWKQAARYAGVTFVYWGAQEKEEWPGNIHPWASRQNLVAEGKWGKIYRLPQ